VSADDGEAKLLPLHNRGLVAVKRGDLKAGERWFRDAKVAAAHKSEFACVLDLRLAEVALAQGRSGDAIEGATAVLASEEARAVTRAMAAETLVAALIDSGEVAASVDLAERFVVEAATQDPFSRILGGTALAHARLAAGDVLGAEEAALDADALASRMSEVDYRRSVLHVLGLARQRRGDLVGAAGALTDALSLIPSFAPPQFYGDLAAVEREAGDAAGAWRRLCEALRTAVAIGNGPAAATLCCYLADTAASRGDLAAAASLLGAAEGLRSKAGIERGPVRARGDEAEAALAHLDEAESSEMERYREEGRSLGLEAILSVI